MISTTPSPSRIPQSGTAESVARHAHKYTHKPAPSSSFPVDLGNAKGCWRSWTNHRLATRHHAPYSAVQRPKYEIDW